MERKVINVFVVGPAKNYANAIINHKLVDSIKEADVVIFTGGEDVYPGLYGETVHQTTYYNIERDKEEAAIFNKIPKNKLVVGICRGSQFLCIMNGGKLIQDVTNHACWGTHMITNGAKVIDITSTHHQMQYPFNLDKKDYDILYKSYENFSDYYHGSGVEDNPVPCEPEIVLYHKKDMPVCLAIQGHPEYMRHDSAAVIEINDIINKLL